MIRIFHTQLSLKSLIKISATINFIGGLVFGVLFFIIALFGEPTIVDLISVVATPAVAGINGVMMAVVAYPFYKRWWAKIKGQKVSGFFVEAPSNGTQQTN